MTKPKEESLSSEVARNALIAAKTAADSATIIATVANDVEWMKKSLSGIENKLNEMDKAFVTAAQHQEVLKELSEHEARLNLVETEKTKLVVLTTVVGAILTFLVSLLVYHLFQS